MSSSGFKGNRLGIDEVSIRGSHISVGVQFLGEEGVVHATSKHTLDLGTHTDIREAARELMEALHNTIVHIHFESPEVGTPIEEVARGIAESLESETDEPG